jgi:hypothetical protein
MADLSKIKLPSGSEYNIKDQTARDMIAALNQFTYEVVTSLPTAADTTMYKIYLIASETPGTSDSYTEYITVDKGASASPRYVWEKLGTITTPDLSEYAKSADLGDLAWKDTASGSVAVPKTYTTTTTTNTTESKSVSVSGTTTGSVTLTKGTVDVKPNTTGTAANKYTPAGSVTSNFTGTSSSGTISGTATAPTISVKTAGTTGKVTGITSVGSMPTYTVSNEVLTITAGSTPTADTEKTFKTGDAAYQAGTSSVSGSCSVTPSGSVSSSFTGTDTYFKTAVAVGTAASFTGASMTSTGSVEVPKTFTSSTTTATTENRTVTVW